MCARHRPTMLVVDDDHGSAGLLRDIFRQEGYEITVAYRGEEALALIDARPFDVVLCDVQLPDVDGIDLLRHIRGSAPRTAIIMVTAYGTYETTIKALHEGASDYVRKPFTVQEVRLTVERVMERRRLQNIAAAAGNAPSQGPEARPIIGRNPAMVELFKLVSRVAAVKSSVLIQGESGTGKELIARTIHQGSPRSGRPFVAVNVTSLTETLLESELFGHVRGAFTGAIERRAGLFVEANHGTIFLDEIGDMSLPMQAKLLRVLQEHEVKAVGASETTPVDVRMVTATHQDLESLVRAGRFREDLYYRLNVVTLHLPLLRERPEDIPLLAEHFLRRFGAASNRPLTGFSSAAMDALQAYSWPGNVRELENVVDRAVALAPGSTVELSDLPDKLVMHLQTGGRAVPVPVTSAEGEPRRATLDEVIRTYVLEVLGLAGGNKTEAARLLDVPRRTLYRMLDRYGAIQTRKPKPRPIVTSVSD